VDSTGKKAVEYFRNVKHPDYDMLLSSPLLLYLTVQKLRTPKGWTISQQLRRRNGLDIFHLLT